MNNARFTPMVRFTIFKYKALLGILLLYVMLAAVYSTATPLFEAPDEVWHYGYVHWIAGGNGLSHPDDMSGAGVGQWAQEGSQPPLYYLLAGLLTAPLPQGDWGESVRYNQHAAIGNAEAVGNRNHLLHGGWDDWPWRGLALGAHVARLFSIALGAVTVVFAWLGGRLLLTPRPDAGCLEDTWCVGRDSIPLLAAALVAFTPQFLFITASVSNDNLVTVVCAAGVWLAAALACGRVALRRRWLIVLGLLVGLAALSKLSGLLLGPFALLCLGIAAWRQRSQPRAWRPLLEGCALVMGVAALIAGWWYWRNWQLYGDPLGLAAMFAVGPARDEAAGVAELLALVPGVWRSAWAVFGWFNVTAPEWVYWLYTGLAAAALGGWAWLLLRRLPRKGWFPGSLPAALLALWSLAVTAALVRWAQINFPQGRLLFPAIAAAMPLLAVGLLAWFSARWRSRVALAVGGGMALLAAATPFLWIAPAYTPPPLLAAGANPLHSADARFGEHIQLAGYDAPLGEITGAAVDVTLYWRTDAPLPANYSVFVHLVDELGIVQAQNDSHPALGGRPTSSWRPGQVIVDQHRLRLPTGLPPGRMAIEVGMYDYASGERLPVAIKGGAQPLGGPEDTLPLASFTLPPQRSATGIPNPTRINFGDQIALTGYDLQQRSLRPGDSLPVTFWWEALAPMERDYVAFVHLVLPPGAVWAQLDRMPHSAPGNKLTPTSMWPVGQVIEDTFVLEVPPETPLGVYDVTIGWYDKDTFERLPVEFDDTDVLIARVRVQEAE
jgi:hypothetical protein